MINELSVIHQGRLYITPMAMPVAIDIHDEEGWAHDAVELAEGIFVVSMPTSEDELCVSRKALGRPTKLHLFTAEEIAQIGDISAMTSSEIAQAAKDFV